MNLIGERALSLDDAGEIREATVQALPRIIQYFRSYNVKFATISEISNLPKDAIMPRYILIL